MPNMNHQVVVAGPVEHDCECCKMTRRRRRGSADFCQNVSFLLYEPRAVSPLTSDKEIVIILVEGEGCCQEKRGMLAMHLLFIIKALIQFSSLNEGHVWSILCYTLLIKRINTVNVGNINCSGLESTLTMNHSKTAKGLLLRFL